MKRRSEAPVRGCRRPARSASRARGRRRPRPPRSGAGRRPGRARSRSPSRGSARRRRRARAGSRRGTPARAPPCARGGARRRSRAPPRARSAISPVPSGELSSITSTRTSAELAERAHHRARRSRARCRWGGRRSPARAVSSLSVATTLPRNAGRGRAARAAGRPAASSRASRRSACSPTAAPPRGSARRAAPVAQLALDGKAKELPGDRQDDRGEDRPDRRGRRDRTR